MEVVQRGHVSLDLWVVRMGLAEPLIRGARTSTSICTSIVVVSSRTCGSGTLTRRRERARVCLDVGGKSEECSFFICEEWTTKHLSADYAMACTREVASPRQGLDLQQITRDFEASCVILGT